MSDTNASQRQKQLEGALFLFSEPTMKAITEAERRGEHMLERLREQHPEKIPEAIKLRGQFMVKSQTESVCFGGITHLQWRQELRIMFGAWMKCLLLLD